MLRSFCTHGKCTFSGNANMKHHIKTAKHKQWLQAGISKRDVDNRLLCPSCKHSTTVKRL